MTAEPSPHHPRYAVARALGRSAARLSQVTGRGSGTTVGGRVTLALDPLALQRAATGRRLAVVSGTNGKTTTRTLLVAALSTLGPVVSNSGGANLPTGLTAALTADTTADVGVLEVDEPFVPQLLATTRPGVLVLLNLTRDQLDRYAEVRRLAGIWREALGREISPVVVANADDPLVVWAASAAREVRWVAAGLRWRFDASACPACGDVVQYDDRGDWSSGCGLRRPAATWTVDGQTLRGPDGMAYDVRLALPGPANVGNAALAAAAAAEFGVAPRIALAAMANISGVEGRYVERTVTGRPVRLLLAKNPAGWQEALGVVRPEATHAVVSINARAADGRDPAWLWDVPFEVLAGRFVTATGERARDVAVRLRYAGVEHQRIDDPARALRHAGGDGPLEVLANYTAFQTLHKILGDKVVGDG